jgi:hypothetical protein
MLNKETVSIHCNLTQISIIVFPTYQKGWYIIVIISLVTRALVIKKQAAPHESRIDTPSVAT